LLAALANLLGCRKLAMRFDHALNAVDLGVGDVGGEPDAADGGASEPGGLDDLVACGASGIGVVENDVVASGREESVEPRREIGQSAAEQVAVEALEPSSFHLAGDHRF